ncbi:SRPBCC family protein [Flavobacterium soli]|uniref:SRPBCC family protein n=1 Tax=Flavobacterium soli TaxID=344881 RepID=UPI0004018700|nr:SRPBCC family protein [Flavobacterium soli]
MNTLTEETKTTPESTHFMKRDDSGTDPNRYANFSEEDCNKILNQNCPKDSIIPGVKVNVSTVERILMVAAGGYLLCKGLSGKNKSAAQSIAGTTMLARGITGYCPMYDMAGKTNFLKSSNVNIRTSVQIGLPVHEVYDFWRNLENLPKFMKHLEKVEEKNSVTSHWTAKGPGGIGTISWDANILMDEPGKMLSWHSLPGSTVDNAGKILFKENGTGGTELDVTISYHAPLGVAGETAAKWLNPYFEKIVKDDIQNLKSFLETGQEVISV